MRNILNWRPNSAASRFICAATALLLIALVVLGVRWLISVNSTGLAPTANAVSGGVPTQTATAIPVPTFTPTPEPTPIVLDLTTQVTTTQAVTTTTVTTETGLVTTTTVATTTEIVTAPAPITQTIRLTVPVIITGTVVNVRVEATTSSRAFTTVKKDQILGALARSGDAQWVLIVLPNGKTGWVSSQFVKPMGDWPISALPVSTEIGTAEDDQPLPVLKKHR